MPPKATKSAAPSQRRIKNTASKQIRNRSRRQRQDKTPDAAGDDDESDSHDSQDDRDAVEVQRHQQRLLDIFRDSFRASLEDTDTFATVLQEIKQALYEREFGRAFADPRNLEVYAARWSPTRALCYARIFEEVKGEIENMMQSARLGAFGSEEEKEDDDDNSDVDDAGAEDEEVDTAEADPETDELAEKTSKLEVDDGKTPSLQPSCPRLPVLSIGGGAAELVAFASHMSRVSPSQVGHITLLDAGPWSEVVQTLHTHATTPPVLSKYANAAAKAANAALVTPPERLSSEFVHADILDLGSSPLELRNLLWRVTTPPPLPSPEVQARRPPPPLLITLLFTANELYTAFGINQTTKFLRNLTLVAAPGTLLLVVDSPGSYSEASIGKEGAKKKYPMQWLLDATLLNISGESDAARRRRAERETTRATSENIADEKDGEVQQQQQQPGEQEVAPKFKEAALWEKVEERSHESAWFRMPEGLWYPIALENMRYQMHLYRAL